MSGNNILGHWRQRTLFSIAVFLLLYSITLVLWQRTITSELGNHQLLGSLMEKFCNIATQSDLPSCSRMPQHLQGVLQVQKDVTIEEAEKQFEGVYRGGIWWPSHCKALWKVAIIIPYRNRSSQIGPFLMHMHAFLQRQELNYSIYLVEQEGSKLFNKGRVMNIGYLESRKEGPWDCFVFHDIDLLPENDHNLYHCTSQPLHLAVAVSTMNYRLLYHRLIGGATLMTEHHIQTVNGWSNKFWGWGAEDDDMWNRIYASKMGVFRFHEHIARYKTLPHEKQILNKQRMELLKKNRGKHMEDGLNTLQYVVKKFKRKPLYTYILADVGSDTEAQP